MQVMQLAGRMNHGASAPFYNRGKWSSTEQGEREIGASLQLNAARRINHIRHVAFCISRRRMHAANIVDCSMQVNSAHC